MVKTIEVIPVDTLSDVFEFIGGRKKIITLTPDTDDPFNKSCNYPSDFSEIRGQEFDEGSQKLIEMAIEKLGLSARAYAKVLKIARTIADIEEDEKISAGHVAGAIQYRIQYRSLDRKMI